MEQLRIGNPETRQNWGHKTQNEDEQNKKDKTTQKTEKIGRLWCQAMTVQKR